MGKWGSQIKENEDEKPEKKEEITQKNISSYSVMIGHWVLLYL